MTSRVYRALASCVFVLAGLAYIILPPNSPAQAFGTDWQARAWGVIFCVGGAISLIGVMVRYSQVERFGVGLVIIASVCLTISQTLVMLDGPTWTRLAGTLVYLGYTMWAVERWHSLGGEVQAIRALGGDDGD